MFTVGAFFFASLIAWLSQRKNDQDRSQYQTEERDWLVALHVRQDIKLIAFLLAGIIIMLGVIADRVG